MIKSFRSIYLPDFSDFLVVFEDEKRFKAQPIRWPVHDHVTTRNLQKSKRFNWSNRSKMIRFVIFKRWVFALQHIDQIRTSYPHTTLMTDYSEFVESFLKYKLIFSIWKDALVRENEFRKIVMVPTDLSKTFDFRSLWQIYLPIIYAYNRENSSGSSTASKLMWVTLYYYNQSTGLETRHNLAIIISA